MSKSAPEFSSIKRATLPVQAAQAIQDQIESGAIKPNELLPSERVLAEAFDVSRAAIREAIQLLQAKGYVVVQQGKGSLVVDPAVRSASSLASWMAGRHEQLHMMVELRRIVEPGIAELAAQNATAQEGAALVALAAELETCSRAELSDKDAAFHRQIARLTGNDLVSELLDACLVRSEPLREQTLKDRQRRLLAAAGHMNIARAIAGGDRDGARTAMLDHLNDAVRSI